LKTQNRIIICTTRFPHKLWLWNRNPNFRLRLHRKRFRLRFPIIEITWVPGFTSLVPAGA